jgi:hypothetical protein
MSKQQELREWLKVVSVVAIPVVVVIMGAVFAKANATREVNAKMVEIAAGVLTGLPTDSNPALRQWAMDVIKHYSEVPISASAESTAISRYLLAETMSRTPRLPDLSARLARIIISPKNRTVSAGTLATFIAVGLTVAGDTAIFRITWGATGGKMIDTSSSQGRYRAHFLADTVGGNFRVIASSQGIADTALVHVRPLLPP